jgi:hypothetical protein
MLNFFCIIIYSDLVHCFVFKTVCVTHHQAACVIGEISSSRPPWCSDFSSCSEERIASSLIEWLIDSGVFSDDISTAWLHCTECYGYCIRDLARPLKDILYTDHFKVWCQHFLARTGEILEIFSQANRSPNQCSISKPREQELTEMICQTLLYFWEKYRKLSTRVKPLQVFI